MAIFFSTVTEKEGDISTIEAPYEGSVITALLSLPRKLRLKSTTRSEGEDIMGVEEMVPAETG